MYILIERQFTDMNLFPCNQMIACSPLDSSVALTSSACQRHPTKLRLVVELFESYPNLVDFVDTLDYAFVNRTPGRESKRSNSWVP